MEAPDIHEDGQDFEDIGMTSSDYVMTVLQAGGSLLHVNRIGNLTLTTTYRSQGRFEHVVWNNRFFEQSVTGWVFQESGTLEMANGYHLALVARVWSGPHGQGARERAKWFTGDIDQLLRQLGG